MNRTELYGNHFVVVPQHAHSPHAMGPLNSSSYSLRQNVHSAAIFLSTPVSPTSPRAWSSTHCVTQPPAVACMHGLQHDPPCMHAWMHWAPALVRAGGSDAPACATSHAGAPHLLHTSAFEHVHPAESLPASLCPLLRSTQSLNGPIDGAPHLSLLTMLTKFLSARTSYPAAAAEAAWAILVWQKRSFKGLQAWATRQGQPLLLGTCMHAASGAHGSLSVMR